MHQEGAAACDTLHRKGRTKGCTTALEKSCKVFRLGRKTKDLRDLLTPSCTRKVASLNFVVLQCLRLLKMITRNVELDTKAFEFVGKHLSGACQLRNILSVSLMYEIY